MEKYKPCRRSFNPRLPLPGGDAIYDQDEAERIAVSIHASRCREAMPELLGLEKAVQTVSIHASRCREAMRLNS